MNARRRTTFVATILLGSFLLFLVQPMVARMALPRLGGAPNVWNSAMLVYQALLLAGYAYAHALGRLALRRQAIVHIAVLVVAALTLPIALADLPPAATGAEVLWVPLLFLATIGPLFFAVSAQAPLMQRWYAADPAAGDPYPLYAASNLGSFAGLLAYPIVVEPLLPLRWQSAGWAIGYGVLVVLVFLSARALPAAKADAPATAPAADDPISTRRIVLWLALSAVPSGLMLSTTTFLTTDIMAMPLLWVIPLGLYLLSFSIAFAASRRLAHVVMRSSAALVMVLGAATILLGAKGSIAAALVSVALLFVVAVALHARLYETRPSPARLTLFYLVMSAGGALGGAVTALIAPVLFDWTWEHPLLIVAAALLVPLPHYARWTERFSATRARPEVTMALVLALCLLAVDALARAYDTEPRSPLAVQSALAVVAVLMLLLVRWRLAFAGLLALTMLAVGLADQVRTSLSGDRSRSYFGIYSVRDVDATARSLAHGTTLHGIQLRTPGRELEPTTYYGRTSGVGLALGAGDAVLGSNARIGIVGLGTGTLACYRRPGQTWTIYEIDPAVLALSRDGRFTFIERCAPEADIVIGDARLELAKAPKGALDFLAIDAFSSDAVPLHLLTDEAFKVYLGSLADDGLLLVHISNRYIDLAPPIAAVARANGLSAIQRKDIGVTMPLTSSIWIALSRDPARLAALQRSSASEWSVLEDTNHPVWTDDFASILPDLNWRKFL